MTETAAIRINLVLIAVEHVHFRIGGEMQRNLTQSIGTQEVVLVQESKELTRCEPRGGIRAPADVSVLFPCHEPDSLVAGSQVIECLGQSRVSTRIVGEAPLPIAVDLLTNTPSRLQE